VHFLRLLPVRKASSVVGPLLVGQLESALGRFLDEVVLGGLVLVISVQYVIRQT
jgi:hypothetical protein